MLEKIIKNTIKQNILITPGMHVILGLSGGPDSLCLYNALKNMEVSYGLTIHAVHVNHNIRGEEADADQKFVENLVNSDAACGHAVDVKSENLQCEQYAAERKISTEEAGRILRYEAFDNRAKEIQASGVNAENIRIAVAHNADDQAETVLFRIIRGSGTDGISGMRYMRNSESGFKIIRPLLDCKKADILEYCKENGLEPRIDKTNAETLYTRNKIRLELIPMLEKYNPNVKDALIRLANVSAADRDCLENLADNLFKDALIENDEISLILNDDKLKNSPEAVRNRVIMKAFKSFAQNENISQINLADVNKIIFSEKPSVRAELPGGVFAAKNYENLKIGLAGQRVTEDLQSDLAKGKINYKVTEMSIDDYRASDYAKAGKANALNFASFDAEKLKQAGNFKIELRSRKPGDYIVIKSTKGLGKKKVQDLFVDEKVPKDMRDSVELFALGNEVLFIPTQKSLEKRKKYSKNYSLSENTKLVLIIEVF